MITPGLIRRAWVRAASWRLIALSLCLTALLGWIAAHPWAAFFNDALGHLPGADKLAGALGSRTLTELLALAGDREHIRPEIDLFSALLLTFVTEPLFDAAILAVVRTDDALPTRELFAGAGGYFGRMFRMGFSRLIPVAIGAAIGGIAMKWADGAGDRATTERAADQAMNLGLAFAAFGYLFAAIWTDAARAFFVAQPARRSAFFAIWAGGWMMLRRPLRSLAIGVATLLPALLLAALTMIARQQLEQSTGGKVALALLLSELALAFLAWGRAARLLGFCELAQADVLARAEKKERFEMAPPRTSPPAPIAPVQTTTELKPSAAVLEAPLPIDAVAAQTAAIVDVSVVAAAPQIEVIAIAAAPIVEAPAAAAPAEAPAPLAEPPAPHVTTEAPALAAKSSETSPAAPSAPIDSGAGTAP